jgi:hypothetical protein
MELGFTAERVAEEARHVLELVGVARWERP